MPRVYLFLISSGGFSLLFTYGVIVATQIGHRKKNGCPPSGKCQVPGYPYISWIVLAAIIMAIASMPFIPGQSVGLIAGLALLLFYSLVYKVLQIKRSGAGAFGKAGIVNSNQSEIKNV